MSSRTSVCFPTPSVGIHTDGLKFMFTFGTDETIRLQHLTLRLWHPHLNLNLQTAIFDSSNSRLLFHKFLTHYADMITVRDGFVCVVPTYTLEDIVICLMLLEIDI